MKESTQPLNALTGLRWVAALAVFVHHVNFHFGLPAPKIWLGGLAVSFFFMLSGFILTYVYAGRLPPTGKGVRKFWLTRWARIWPLHVTCLLIFVFVFPRREALFSDFWYSAKFITNLTLLQSWVPLHEWVFSFNGVSWSISTESFFYFMFPFLLIGGERKFWWKFGIVGVIVGAMVIYFSQLALDPLYNERYNFVRFFLTNPLLRLPEFCSGMAVGFFYLRRQDTGFPRNFLVDTKWEILAIGLFLTWNSLLGWQEVAIRIRQASWGSMGLSYWLMMQANIGTFAILIFVFSRSRGLLARLAGSRIMVILGEVSFAFYMTHNIVIVYIKFNLLGDSKLPPEWAAGCAFCLSLALSILLFKLVEMPAKSALLALSEGRVTEASRSVAHGLLNFARSPVALLVLLLIAVPVSIFALKPFQLNLEQEVKSIIAGTTADQRNVCFDNTITLLGYRATSQADKISLEMAWLMSAKLEHRRFLHICDKTDKVIGQGMLNDAVFAAAELHKPFLDRVVLSKRELRAANYLGIGFFDLGTKSMLSADHGPRSLSGFRLNILTSEQLPGLLGELKPGESPPHTTSVE